jgi:hypothetical protein
MGAKLKSNPFSFHQLRWGDQPVQRLVLHIGTEKTGTSTIQRFLHSNRDRLLADGWTYPRSLGEPDQRQLAALCNDDAFVDAFLRRRGLADSRLRSKARRTWSDAFAKELAGATTPNMVISSEHLSSRLFTPTEMERVRQFLAPHFDRIDIVVLLRDPLDAALSLVSTQVQTGYTRGSLPPPPTTWGEGNDRSWISVCDHRQTLQRWEAAFPGSLTVRLFERDGLTGGSILTEIRTILGLRNTPEYAEPSRTNESLQARVVAVAPDSGNGNRVTVVRAETVESPIPPAGTAVTAFVMVPADAVQLLNGIAALRSLASANRSPCCCECLNSRRCCALRQTSIWSRESIWCIKSVRRWFANTTVNPCCRGCNSGAARESKDELAKSCTASNLRRSEPKRMSLSALNQLLADSHVEDLMEMRIRSCTSVRMSPKPLPSRIACANLGRWYYGSPH